MSRLWSRFGIRALAVGLLVMGVAGGAYLGKNRETQQTGIDAVAYAEADQLEQQVMKDHMREQSILLATKRAAEQQARAKAAAAAKAAAQRAKAAEEAARRKRAEKEAAEKEAESKPPTFGPIPSSCKEYSGNRAIGCTLLLEAGFKLDQMPCLDKLWDHESGWNHKASNDSTGAYGIPQALPGSKMAAFGDDWKTNPATQIEWGLNYLKNRYDSPCGGWSKFQSAGWY